ncbi:hypothetical protein [Streptomyces parvulus]|uniref:hypothetical protein n=1 Tax=Streptomyces parvulus TaxID=146923 RepID=UPI0011C03076|nr:hypothetical protein [Streptomyces parvulus]
MRTRITDGDGSHIFIEVASKQDAINLSYLAGKAGVGFALLSEEKPAPNRKPRVSNPGLDPSMSISKMVRYLWIDGVTDRETIREVVSQTKGYAVPINTIHRTINRMFENA